MPRNGWLVSTIILLSACEGVQTSGGERLPQAEVSTHKVNFGDVNWGETVLQDVTITNSGGLPLGVSSIALGTEEMEANFILNLGSTVVCGDEASDTPEDATEEEDGDDAEDTAASTDAETDDNAISTQSVITIGPDCSYTFQVGINPVSVGKIFGSINIETATDDADPPNYYRDPDRFRDTVILEGLAEQGEPNIVVSPRTLDFGFPYPGEPVTKYIEVHNVGSGDLTLEHPVLDDDCDERFEFDHARLTDGVVLEARTSTLLSVTYTPTTGSNAECEMTLASDDIDKPSSRVSIRGHKGSNPLCTPPTIEVISPAPGYIHGTLDDLVLELRAFDAEQPPPSLHCSVTSVFQEEAEELADCTPYNQSGHTVVSIPASSLMEGTDTILIEVQDDCGFESYAATSVVYRSTYPPSDDDGDGYSDTVITNPDCDDDDVLVYPMATEIFDGKDNDCDGEIDENTEGMDDDGDGFSEIDGDCNDVDDTMYPGAPELQDTKDNDCNGTVDDNTGLYDDDGDGFAETDNDCNDNNSEISPAAIEYCGDGIDNNCNGLMDQRDGCTPIDAGPIILGGIQMESTALGKGESTIMTVDVYDADGDELTFSWQEDIALTEQGHNGFDSIATQTVTWTAPSNLPEGSKGEIYTVYVIVNDGNGHEVRTLTNITVYPDPVLQTVDAPRAAPGCTTASTGIHNVAGAAWAFPMMLAVLGLRRRED